MAKKYGLLIGTSEFSDRGLKTLVAPEEDVTRFRDVLLDKDYAAFDSVKIFMNSSLAIVRKAVSDLFADRKDDDLILLYYSGHGLTDTRGRLYFALPATDSEEPSPVSLDADYVRQKMDDSNSLRQIIILDCCHSGAFTSDTEMLSRDANGPILTKTTFDPIGHGRFVLSASSASESSFEKNGKSIYTQTLVNGLMSGEAAPEKEEITIADLHAYLKREVKRTKAPMQPQFWFDNRTGPFVISRNPNVRVPIKKEIEEALQSDNTIERLGAITLLEGIVGNGPLAQRAQALKLLKERASDPDERNNVSKAARAIIENARRDDQTKKSLAGNESAAVNASDIPDQPPAHDVASHKKPTQTPAESTTPESTTTATDEPNKDRGSRVFDWVKQHLYGVVFVLFIGAVAAWSAYKIPELTRIENTVEKSSQEFLRLLGEQDAGAISDMVEIPFFYGDDRFTNPDKAQVLVLFSKLFEHASAGTGQESDNIHIRLGAALSGYLSREMKREDFDVFKTVSIEDIEPELQGEKEKERGDIPEPRISIGDDGARVSVRVSGYKPLDVMYLFFSVRGDASGLRGILLQAKD